jgi:hypothetical protein
MSSFASEQRAGRLRTDVSAAALEDAREEVMRSNVGDLERPAT